MTPDYTDPSSFSPKGAIYTGHIAHLVVLRLTFHLSLTSFARSGHCLGAATQGFLELLNPRAQAAGQTHYKPSINIEAGLMGWAACGSTSWEIFFMMLWKPVGSIPG